jgi:tetratricopeptide (TPR) repeat protein
MDFNNAFGQTMDTSLEKFENEVKEEFSKNNQIYKEPNKLDTADYTDIKIQCLEIYIHNNENDIRAYETLTNYYESNGDIEKAIELLKSGIDENPKESILWRRLGIIYEDNNKIDLANECYKKEKLLKNDK